MTKHSLQVQIDKELHDEFVRVLDENSHSKSKIVRKMIEEYIKENEGEK